MPRLPKPSFPDLHQHVLVQVRRQVVDEQVGGVRVLRAGGKAEEVSAAVARLGMGMRLTWRASTCVSCVTLDAQDPCLLKTSNAGQARISTTSL